MFNALVVSRFMYALPAIYGHLKQNDTNRINKFFRKAKRWGLTSNLHDIDLMATQADTALFKLIMSTVSTNCFHLRAMPIPLNYGIDLIISFCQKCVQKCTKTPSEI